MRLKASLGALAGVACMVTAAAVPRLDEVFETTCSSTAVEEATAVPPTSTSSSISLGHATTPISNSSCSSAASGEATAPWTRSSPIPKATTFTITSSTACFSATASALPGFLSANSSSLGLPSVNPGSNSSSCSSSDTAAPVLLSPTTLSAPVTVTVTKVTALSTTTVSAAPTTITLPVLSATTAESVATVTISEDSGESTLFDSDTTITVPSVSQPTGAVTLPEPVQTEATSVLTLTFPDGPRHTATVLITIPIPEVSITPGLWSTVATPQTITGTSAGEDVTVTVYTSSTSTVLFEPKCSLSSAAATDDQQSSPAESVTTITVPASLASALARPYVLTYTLSPDSNLPTPFTGTVTVTPLPPPANWAGPSSSTGGSWQVDSQTESFTPLGTLPTPSLSGAPRPPDSTAPLASTSTYTVTLQDSLSAHTSIPTVTDSASTASPTVIVTVLTPRPINPSTTVPFIPLTVTLTLSDTATLLTNPTLFSPSPQTSGQTGGSSSSPSNERPDLATITVTTLGSSTQDSPDSNPTVTSSGERPPFVTAAASGPPSPSSNAASTYRPEPSLSTATVLPVTSAASSPPLEGSGTNPLSILTISVTEPSAYGFVSSGTGVTAPTQSSGASLSAPESNASTMVVTVTESPLSTMPTPSSPIVSASAPSSDSTGSVVLVTYTVPGQSGIGASTYTVTYTVHPSTTSAASESQADTSDSIPGQTSESPILTTSSAEGLSTVTFTSRAPFTLTVTPSDASGTPITITYTPGQPNIPASSTTGPDESFISSEEPISATRQTSEYGAVPSSTPDTGYGSLSDTTETSADLPVGVTTSNAPRPSTTSNNLSTAVTVTEGTGGVPTGVVPTVSPSNSSAVVSGNPTASTDWGQYQTSTTGAARATSASNQPTVVTVTGDVPTAPASASVSTVVVSLVTLSQTVPLGYGSSTVVEFTTEVTVGFSSQTAPSSTPLTTPLRPPSSVSVVSPSPYTSSVDEVSSAEPVSSSKWPTGGNRTSTRPVQTPVVVTIWPTPTSALSSTSDQAVTAHPGSTTQLASTSLVLTSPSTDDSEPISVSSTSCTSEEASAVEPIGTSQTLPSIQTPSEVTIWPTPALNSSCSTFSTSYRSSNGSVVLSTSTAPLFSVTTLSPAPTSSMLSGTGESSSCTETLSGASIPIITTIPPATGSETDMLSEFAPPAETEFHHPAHAITDNSIAIETSTFGGYDFSGSGNPAETATASRSTNPVTSVSSDLPVSQPQPSASGPVTYGAPPVVISESADPNAISTPFISSAIEPDTTVVTQTEIESTTSSAGPVPIVTSLPSPDDLTSSVVLFTPGPISTHLASSAASLSTTLLVSQSSVSANSTAPSSSSRRASTSTMLLSSVPHITFTFSPTPLPTTATPSSSTVETTSSEVPLPPVIVTLTVTTTIISESVTETSPPTAPAISSSATNAVSMLTLPSAASSAIVTSVTLPGITSSVALTSVTATPTISTSALGSNATLPTSLPAVSTPLLNSTVLSSTAVLVTPTVTAPFLNSSTPVHTLSSYTLSSSQAPVNVSTSAPTAFVNSTTSTVLATTVSPPLFPNSTTAALSSDAPITFFSITISASTSTMFLNSTATPTAVGSAESTRFPRSLPVACGAEGDLGAVVFEFDDIPELWVGRESDRSGPTQQPVPAPYHRFLFSDGFHVVSQADTKYQPSSGSQMVQHDGSSVAQVGLGQWRGNQCFRFDFQGISLGCESADEPCVFELTGLQWNGVEDVVQANTTFKAPACQKSSSCPLQDCALDWAVSSSFANLTAINITLVGPSESLAWWADDLRVAWTNNDCTAATCRARVANTVTAPRTHGSFAGSAKGLLRWAVRG